MTFIEYIIQEKGKGYYLTSLDDMKKCGSTLTLKEWFGNLYAEYQILYNNTNNNLNMNPFIKQTVDKISKHISLTDGDLMFLSIEIGTAIHNVICKSIENPELNLNGEGYIDENTLGNFIGKTNVDAIDKVQKKSEEIFTLVNVGNMSLTEINTLTDKERYFLSKWFVEKAKNEMEIYKSKI